jgi:transcriptional regulator with XRE-family HTH domain
VTLFGQRLNARRSELGLTLLAVATEAGVSVPYVANLERGRGNPTLDVIVALASALGVSPANLLGEDDDEQRVDELFADLPAVLVDYARGKFLRQQTEWLAEYLALPVEDARTLLVRAMAAAPRPADRRLTQNDCRRLLDAYTLILTDNEE